MIGDGLLSSLGASSETVLCFSIRGYVKANIAVKYPTRYNEYIAHRRNSVEGRLYSHGKVGEAFREYSRMCMVG